MSYSATVSTPYASPATVRALNNANRKRKLLPVLAVCSFFIAMLTLLWVRVEIQQRSYSIEGLRQENLSQDRMLRDLTLRFESLLNPAQMRHRANETLGMANIKPQQVRYILFTPEVP